MSAASFRDSVRAFDEQGYSGLIGKFIEDDLGQIRFKLEEIVFSNIEAVSLLEKGKTYWVMHSGPYGSICETIFSLEVPEIDPTSGEGDRLFLIASVAPTKDFYGFAIGGIFTNYFFPSAEMDTDNQLILDDTFFSDEEGRYRATIPEKDWRGLFALPSESRLNAFDDYIRKHGGKITYGE